MSFNAEKKVYLRSQRLARLATASGDGQPDVAPVGFDFDGSHFYIAGPDLPSTRKYRNVTGGPHKVALVVDDAIRDAVDPEVRARPRPGQRHPTRRQVRSRRVPNEADPEVAR